jgi:hypothetical protein
MLCVLKYPSSVSQIPCIHVGLQSVLHSSVNLPVHGRETKNQIGKFTSVEKLSFNGILSFTSQPSLNTKLSIQT